MPWLIRAPAPASMQQDLCTEVRCRATGPEFSDVHMREAETLRIASMALLAHPLCRIYIHSVWQA